MAGPGAASPRLLRTEPQAGCRRLDAALDGVDHVAVIDPTTAAWAACRAALEELLA